MALVSVLAFTALAKTNTPNEPTTPTDIPSAFNYYADEYHVSLATLLRVANCESGIKQNYEDGYPVLGSAGELGIMQFKTGTFYRYARKMGLKNPNILDPIQQIQIASYMFSIGQSGQWSCK